MNLRGKVIAKIAWDFVWLSVLVLALTFVLPSQRMVAEEVVALDPQVQTLIESYCIGCHGPDQQKGDRSFETLSVIGGEAARFDLGDEESRILLEEIVDQLNLGEMPPEDSSFGQPSNQEIKFTVDWMTKTLLDRESRQSANQTVLRRLNRHEYKNTIEDLLGLKLPAVDHTKSFPADESRHGFTNIGEALGMTDAHLDNYLDAADAYLRMALSFEPPRPRKHFKPIWNYPTREKKSPWMYRLRDPEDRYLDIGAGAKDLSSHYALATYSNQLVRGREEGWLKMEPGFYQIEVRAEAIRRQTHGYDPAMIPTDLNPKMQLGLYVANGREGVEAGGVNARTRVGLWDLDDESPKTYQVTVWLDEETFPFLNWDNGPGPSDYWMRDILKRYHDDVEFRGKEGALAWHIVGKNAVPGRAVSDVWNGPLIRIHSLVLRGPLPRNSQSTAQNEFFDGEHDPTKIDLADSFMRFATRAFRRPVDRSEIDPYLKVVEHARETLGRSRGEAILLGLKAILVSPDFLYLREDGRPDGRLRPHELANRLSYFLWGSMPDDELIRLADSGEIESRDVLLRQSRRMLSDHRAASLVDRLCHSWLRLDKLGAMPPDKVKFFEYYYHGLEYDMREETHRFVLHMLNQNRPITEFLSADYAFLNYNLAKHYGIDGLSAGLDGSRFQKVSLPTDSHRGGLLGQASILTLTANGVDTSPVVRGIWVLENMLGIRPNPPPPDVEPLEPDVRGTTTLKQRLARHTDIETCRDCHQKFDPLGFPLEFYDAIGIYRSDYRRGRRWDHSKKQSIEWYSAAVDGSGKLASGEVVHDLKSLQNYLLSREEQFRKSLARKLLTLATGREVNFVDQNEIQEIVSASKSGIGFRDLVVKVISSDSFRRQ